MPGKAKRKASPFSKDRAISTVDRRTKPGRVLRSTIADLTAHVGGKPTAVEALLIQSAALKATRLYLLSEKLLTVGDLDGDDSHQCLAWLNSMRQDLTALGPSRLRDITPTLASIAASITAAAPEPAPAPAPAPPEAEAAE